MDLRRYPDAMRFSSNGYFFFFLAAFFAFFAFLAMLRSVVPKSWFSASRQSTCINSDYTTISKLILRALKKVNDRQAITICDRTRPPRDAWTQRAFPDQDGKKFSCGRTKADDREAEPTVGYSAAWWISRRLGNSEVSFRPAQAPSKTAPATRTAARCRAQRSLRYRSDQGDQQKPPNSKQKMFKPFGHRAVSHPAELKVKPNHPFTPENPKANSLATAACRILSANH